jgi:hypothetical protein
VKVEYAFETARVRLYLPQFGETWFFVDHDTTVERFTNQIKQDDSFVKDVTLLVQNTQTGQFQELRDPAEKIYAHLVSHSDRKFYIKLNDNVHEIPTVGG